MTVEDSTTHNPVIKDMVVGIFDTQADAEKVIRRLVEAGIPAKHISIVTQGFEIKKNIEGFVTTGDVVRETAVTGGWVGGLFGLLTGAAFLWVPVFGPLVILGPLVGGVAGALEGGAIGGLVGLVMGASVEKERIPKYVEELKKGKLLVVAHASPEEVEKIGKIMTENQGNEVATFVAA
ncbi:MAG: DUF1269 domain-containing protein [Chloroflexi bacterium]|nr:DUF1269 domain-containing protein [Chloroflexota bacterium]